MERAYVRSAWILGCLGDVSADLSRYHGVVNARQMESASFMAACPRLLGYEGSCTARAMTARAEAERPAAVMSAESLASRPDLAAKDGWAPVFEVARAERRIPS